MVLIEVTLEAYKNIIVLDRVRDRSKLLGDDAIFEEMCDFAPIVTLRFAEAARLVFSWLSNRDIS